ncbi:MAG: methylated-DNA--[protein]-cysteine S-methyltransferase [Burkholderiales bacterium]|nr:methylated-DNA--[protein]-cysteine S-methyltransferase [Burkholderiales bacterium]
MKRSLPTERDAAAAPRWQAVVATPFGYVGIRTAAEHVTEVRYLGASGRSRRPLDALARETCAQIAAYLANPRHRFDVPYALEGSAFQVRVWRAIAAIASGRTRTYGELAGDLGSAARAVGGACGSNPVPLIVPCHRVVAAGGGIGGFMHSRAIGPLTIKQWLLRHEGRC